MTEWKRNLILKKVNWASPHSDASMFNFHSSDIKHVQVHTHKYIQLRSILLTHFILNDDINLLYTQKPNYFTKIKGYLWLFSLLCKLNKFSLNHRNLISSLEIKYKVNLEQLSHNFEMFEPLICDSWAEVF